MKRDRLKYERSYSLGWRDARDGLHLDPNRILTPDSRYPGYSFSADDPVSYKQGWNAYHGHNTATLARRGRHAHRARNVAAGKETA